MKTQTTNDDLNTIERDWHNLKGGDEIFFATGFYEVFDAYPIAKNTVLVKLIVNGRIETHRVRITANSKATCKA